MSSLKLKHSGGNSVIIAGPSSNPAADRTINLNDNYAGNGSFVTADSSGNVGINKSNPSYPFVARRTDASGIIGEFANSSGYGLFIGQASASGEAYLRTGTGQALAFKTNGDNERMRIDSSGKVGIGTNSPSSFDTDGDDFVVSTSGHTGITINSGSAGSTSRGSIYFAEGTAGDADRTRAAIQYQHGDDYMRFITNATERVRIDSSGNLGVGTTSPHNSDSADGGWHVKPSASAGGPSMAFKRPDSTGTTYAASFINGTTGVGWIYYNNSAATYSTASDYRLKENVTAISDGITRLKTLKPSRFNFKVDKDKTVDGFLAHEVSSIVPEAITGEKDAVDSDNKPLYQGIDQSKLVPLLTAALQEAIAKIETLETKVAALEAG